MRRRDFMVTIAGAVLIAPWGARAQLAPGRPVIGFLNSQSPEAFAQMLAGFRNGLREGGYVEDENVAIEYRWAYSDFDRLPAMASELVALNVSAIFASGGPLSAYAARDATTTTPIVFIAGNNEVAAGLVASRARPGGNMTGIGLDAYALNQKRIELLHTVLPEAKILAALVDRSNDSTEEIREIEATAAALNLKLHLHDGNSPETIDAAFAAMAEEGAEMLVVGGQPYYITRLEQIVSLAARYRIPAVYAASDFVRAGGLLNYGVGNLVNAYRMGGIYIARVLDGDDPGEMPIWQETTIELTVNLRTARELGVTVPLEILVQATDVIE